MSNNTEQTDYHSYEYPGENYDATDTHWGEILNDLFEDLDDDVVRKGSYDDRPDAGTEGRWYLATDRNIIFYDDGDDWDPIAGLGTEANPVPGTVYYSAADIASELGLPEYDDTDNAPQSQGRLIYVTGDGDDAEGVYKHDGDSYSLTGGESGALSDSGNDTDSGDDYRLPNAEDNIDLQGDGSLRNADEISAVQLSSDQADLPLSAGTDKKDDRSFDTTYQNATGSELIVNVITDADSGDDTDLFLSSGPTSSFSGGDVDDYARMPDAGDNVRMSLTAIVPDDYYYEVGTLSGLGNDATIQHWVEKERDVQ